MLATVHRPGSDAKPLAWVKTWAAGVLVFGGVLAAVLALGSTHGPRWQRVANGVEHRFLDARDVQADLVRFDLDVFDPTVHVPGAAAPLTAADAAKKWKAVAAINGGFFDPKWRPLGLRVAAGEKLSPLRARVDWGVFVTRDHRARIVHTREYEPTPADETAIQVGPRLLVDGAPVKLKPQVAYRSALAVGKQGRQLTLISTAIPVDANVLARALSRLGDFDSALLLDGGPSAQVFVQAGELALDRAGAYGVPDLLLIRRRESSPRLH